MALEASKPERVAASTQPAFRWFQVQSPAKKPGGTSTGRPPFVLIHHDHVEMGTDSNGVSFTHVW